MDPPNISNRQKGFNNNDASSSNSEKEILDKNENAVIIENNKRKANEKNEILIRTETVTKNETQTKRELKEKLETKLKERERQNKKIEKNLNLEEGFQNFPEAPDSRIHKGGDYQTPPENLSNSQIFREESSQVFLKF